MNILTQDFSEVQISGHARKKMTALQTALRTMSAGKPKVDVVIDFPTFFMLSVISGMPAIDGVISMPADDTTLNIYGEAQGSAAIQVIRLVEGIELDAVVHPTTKRPIKTKDMFMLEREDQNLRDAQREMRAYESRLNARIGK